VGWMGEGEQGAPQNVGAGRQGKKRWRDRYISPATFRPRGPLGRAARSHVPRQNSTTRLPIEFTPRCRSTRGECSADGMPVNTKINGSQCVHGCPRLLSDFRDRAERATSIVRTGQKSFNENPRTPTWKDRSAIHRGTAAGVAPKQRKRKRKKRGARRKDRGRLFGDGIWPGFTIDHRNCRAQLKTVAAKRLEVARGPKNQPGGSARRPDCGRAARTNVVTRQGPELNDTNKEAEKVVRCLPFESTTRLGPVLGGCVRELAPTRPGVRRRCRERAEESAQQKKKLVVGIVPQLAPRNG